jgi:hypothetical protein
MYSFSDSFFWCMLFLVIPFDAGTVLHSPDVVTRSLHVEVSDGRFTDRCTNDNYVYSHILFLRVGSLFCLCYGFCSSRMRLRLLSYNIHSHRIIIPNPLHNACARTVLVLNLLSDYRKYCPHHSRSPLLSPCFQCSPFSCAIKHPIL